MKLLIYHRRHDELRRLVAARRPEIDIVSGFDELTLDRHLPTAEVLLTFRPPLEALPRARALRWIQLSSAGADQLLPVHAALAQVVVTNTRGIHADLMADYVYGVLVMLRWRFPALLRAQAERQWRPELTLPLRGQTLGVVGPGAIGREILRRADAFGLHTVAVRRSPGLVAGAGRVFTADALDQALPLCDHVVVVVPVTAETRGMFGAAQFRAMRPTAHFVNVARGSVVDEAALVRALAERWIAGAALDVFAEQPLSPSSPLWDLPNVIVTPYISGEGLDYAERVAEVFVENAGRWLRGQPLENVVDLERGY